MVDDEASSLHLKAFAARRFDTMTYRALLKQRGRQSASGERVGEQY